MDFMQILTDVNFWIQLIQEFQNLGPFGPILLAASESIFSFLPFIAIVTFHVSIYGEFIGFIYSWIGTTIGSAIVFLIVRFCSGHFLCLQHWPIVKKLRHILSQESLLGLFLITACAFMPSFLINVSYGLSDFDKKMFLKTIFFSKIIMTYTLVLFGSSMKKAMDNPIFIVFALVIFLILYVVSNQLKKKIQSMQKTNR